MIKMARSCVDKKSKSVSDYAACVLARHIVEKVISQAKRDCTIELFGKLSSNGDDHCIYRLARATTVTTEDISLSEQVKNRSGK